MGLRLGGVIVAATVITICSIVLIQDRFPSVGLRSRPQGNCRVGPDGRIACNRDDDGEEDSGKGGGSRKGGEEGLRSTWAGAQEGAGQGSSEKNVVRDFSEFNVKLREPVEKVCYKVDEAACPDGEVRKGPPPDTMRTKSLSASDMIVLQRASKIEGAFLPSTIEALVEPSMVGVKSLADQVQAVKDENGRYNTPTMPRVAFLFITRGPMPLTPLWERFFEGFEELFSIYVHANPEFKPPLADEDPVYNKLFADNLIPSEKVGWGDPTMIDAERRLLAHALLKPTNMRFILLSESCMPLHSFPYIYAYLMGSNQSFLHSACAQNWNCAGRYSPNMQPTITPAHWRKGSQWWTLTRDHAMMAVRDRTIYPVLAHWCKGDDWHRHCYVDEFYFQVLLQMKDENGIASRGPTWAAWAGDAHPVSYEPGKLTEDFLRDLKGRMCSWNGKLRESCFLIVRKVPPESLKKALSIAQDVMGF